MHLTLPHQPKDVHAAPSIGLAPREGQLDVPAGKGQDRAPAATWELPGGRWEVGGTAWEAGGGIGVREQSHGGPLGESTAHTQVAALGVGALLLGPPSKPSSQPSSQSHQDSPVAAPAPSPTPTDVTASRHARHALPACHPTFASRCAGTPVHKPRSCQGPGHCGTWGVGIISPPALPATLPANLPANLPPTESEVAPPILSDAAVDGVTLPDLRHSTA